MKKMSKNTESHWMQFKNNVSKLKEYTIQLNRKKKKKPFKAHTNFNLDFSIKVQFKNSHWPNFATLEQRHCQNLSL